MTDRQLFKTNDLVVRTSDMDCPRMIYCVGTDAFEGDSQVYCQDATGHSVMLSTSDLELVTDALKAREVHPVEPNTSKRTIEDIHEDIRHLFVQMVQYHEAQGLDKKLTLTIRGTAYPGSSSIEIEFIAGVDYDSNVSTHRLDKSVQLADARYAENAALKPKEIPYVVESK